MVVPLRDVNPTSRRAWLTLTLIAINVGVFLAFQLRLEGCDLGRFLYRWAAVPRELLSFDQLPRDVVGGVLRGCEVPLYEKSVVASAVSSMFLHANIGHLFWNMVFLWVFGNNVEDRFGRIRYAFFYLIGGLVATYAFSFLHAQEVQPLIGASGAVAAVLGAYLVFFPSARVLVLILIAVVAVPAWLAIGAWFVLQVFSSAQASVDAGVAFEAHIAGFIAGVLLALLLRGRPRQQGGQRYRYIPIDLPPQTPSG